MTDDMMEQACRSWLAHRGYLITKLEATKVDGVEAFVLPTPSDATASNERPLEAPLSRFDEFWALYPRKVGKEAARKIYEKNDLATQAEIITGLENHLAANAFSNEKVYIKHPSTWLTQKVWKDEPEKRAFPKPQVGGVRESRKALDAFLESDD